MPVDQTRTVRPRTTAGVLAIVGPAMLLVVISSDMVTLVLPMIGSAYGVAKAELAWLVTGFLLTFSIGIPFYGRVADRFSLRSLYVGTLLVFAGGSVVAALAPGFVPIVIGRVIMGAGAAAIPVLSVVAVMRLLPPDRRAVGFGLLGAVGGTGAALGPAFGGVIGQLIGWRGLFWTTAGLALVLLPGVLQGLPATPGADRRPIDVAGGLLLGSSIGALLLGVTQGQTNGFGSPASWPLIIAAPVLAVLFVWRLRTAAHPFVTPGLFAHRAFTAATLTVLLAMAVNLATLVFVPTMIIEENALTPGLASVIMIPGGIALGVLSPVAGRLMGRYGPRPPVLGGLIMIAAATLTLAFGAGASPVLVAVAVTGLGAGFAFVITNVTAVAAESQPPELAGAGLGIFQGAQFLGAGTGPALAGVLLDARHGTGPVLPWYALEAPAYSDLFLVLTAVTLIALVIAAGTLRSRP
ncbi:MFS transporter [Microlunatus parietis]|uniref:MFS family permease n=1 Tax=Microlunatus parietis TaxID=682979 RepID=A0A7Y9IAU3_9ACTN|nr:MFS transporter [Microlunatus parietis]NYE73422.1 MFS family permease [Microlunatus parietis]